MRDLQQGSILDLHGQSHGGTIWVQYGKNQPTFTFQKNNFYTFLHKCPQSQPISWTGKVQPIETYVRVQVLALKI